MAQGRPLTSFLAADVGATFTHVCLIERVEGVYRLMARADVPSTHGLPTRDTSEGVIQAVRRIERVTQRQLMGDTELLIPEQDDGSGVDALVVCSSAADPLKCALVGLTDDISMRSASRAVSASNARITTTLRLDAHGGRSLARDLAALQALPLDVILMVGGFDGGAVDRLILACQHLAAAYRGAAPTQRPTLLFAGNQDARRAVADALDQVLDVRVVDNVRPTVQTESLRELQRELAMLYSTRQLTRLPGYDRLAGWCAAPIISTDKALEIAWQYIARRNELVRGVLGVDVGGVTTIAAGSFGESYESVVMHREDAEEPDISALTQWTPHAISARELSDWLENTRLRPSGIPETMEDMLLTHAVARVAMRSSLGHWQAHHGTPHREGSGFDLIAARGGVVAHSPQDGLTALMLIDALQPAGLARLVVDWGSLWPQLGVLASLEPMAATQVLERDALRELGAVIAPIGELRAGDRALSVRYTPDGGETVQFDVPFGTIVRLPLPLDAYATVEIRPHRQLDIGLGTRGAGGQARIRGGTLGIVIDTRGRPIRLPQDEATRRQVQQHWIENLCSL